MGHVASHAPLRMSSTAAALYGSSCPYCQEAVEGLAALDRATRALRAEEQPDSHSLANRVINAARAEVRLGAMLWLDDPVTIRASPRGRKGAPSCPPGS